jgi:hypothetical protein
MLYQLNKLNSDNHWAALYEEFATVVDMQLQPWTVAYFRAVAVQLNGCKHARLLLPPPAASPSAGDHIRRTPCSSNETATDV